MTTSTRECHVMDIEIERDLLKGTIEEEMVNIDQKEPWEASLDEEIEKFKPEEQEQLWNKRSIYHLPAFIKLRKDPALLTPQLVSFGPYHHGEQNLKLVEHYKRKTLLYFFHGAKLRPRNVINAMKGVVKDLQAHYEYLEDKWKNKMEFVKLMVTDGCFMLELLRGDFSKFPTNDPIFGAHAVKHIIPHIKKDMLMLENQLPLLALKTLLLVERSGRNESPDSPDSPNSPSEIILTDDRVINNLVFQFFGQEDRFNTTPDQLGLHVLDLYRKGLCTDFSLWEVKQKSLHTGMLTAVELHEAGVQFKTSNSGSINFDQGVLLLPSFFIDNATESEFLNLMAYENLHAGVNDVLTSYVCFLGELIHSASDVQLLRNAEIISLADGVTEKDAAEILKRLTKEVVHDPTSDVYDVRVSLKRYRRRICGRVNRLLKTRVKKWFSILMDIHFKTPWTTIKIIAAAVALVLTFIQTCYTILSYKYSKK
ncbi:hypothetical protein IHE45_14G089800 [Dioscorea alata]|uniref:Uncharacterized protein n=1 Tax=Dioscorea alata TaxID=55571 RepID=A0ACB7UT93_DIOAL|nr:hypothetical protein IHE45_14G089800 [Dioscorea alata]